MVGGGALVVGSVHVLDCSIHHFRRQAAKDPKLNIVYLLTGNVKTRKNPKTIVSLPSSGAGGARSLGVMEQQDYVCLPGRTSVVSNVFLLEGKTCSGYGTTLRHN